MKKRGYFLSLILATMMFLPTIAMAECTYEDQVRLSSEAANVKVSYEIVEETSDEELKEYEYPSKDYFIVTVMNVTENIRVEISDGWDNNDDGMIYLGYSHVIKAEDTQDGTFTFNVEAIPALRTFSIKVYSLNEQCDEKLERTNSVVLPAYNKYYTSEECKGNSEYYCQKYMTTSFGEGELKMLTDSANKTTESSSSSDVSSESFLQKYGVYILLALVLLVGGYFVIAKVIGKKKQVK